MWGSHWQSRASTRDGGGLGCCTGSQGPVPGVGVGCVRCTGSQGPVPGMGVGVGGHGGCIGSEGPVPGWDAGRGVTGVAPAVKD